MNPYLEDKETVLAETGSSMEGLSEEEAAARLAADGPNRLKEGRKESLLSRFLGELRDPMTVVLPVKPVRRTLAAYHRVPGLFPVRVIQIQHFHTDPPIRLSFTTMITDCRPDFNRMYPVFRINAVIFYCSTFRRKTI